VLVSSVAASVIGTSAGGACDATNFATTGSPTTVNASVAAGNGVGAWSGMTLKMLETGVNEDACKNVTVNIAYTAS
jgi:hypothetical protein